MKSIIKRIVFNRSFIRKLCGHGSIGYMSKIHPLAFLDKTSSIGNYNYIAKYTSITSSTIGNYCSIGPFVKIGLGEHNYKNFSTSVLFEESSFKQLTKKHCIIENDVWIGTGAVILRGVRIQTGAVIGANAVVTKDVPPYTIVGGVPAKTIKKRFDENQIELLMNSKWWNFKPSEVKDKLKNNPNLPNDA